MKYLVVSTQLNTVLKVGHTNLEANAQKSNRHILYMHHVVCFESVIHIAMKHILWLENGSGVFVDIYSALKFITLVLGIGLGFGVMVSGLPRRTVTLCWMEVRIRPQKGRALEVGYGGT